MRGIATPSLVAGIMNAKYVNGMPLARQEREFAGYDLKLSTKTMANWIINCADRYLKRLYDRMKEEFLKSRYIHCDETRLQVIGESEKQGSTQNRMWVYLTDRYSEAPQMVLFDYERTRAGYDPANFLGDQFQGYLTCDSYQAYHGLKDSIIISGCFTHARRRFDAALTALKKDFTKEQLKETVAYQAMARIGASAVVYSITETALLNGVKPYLYLTYVLDQLRRMDPFPKPEDLDRLLPWSGELPEELRTKE